MISSKHLILLGVTGAHFAGLAVIAMAPGKIAPPVELPVVQGILVPPSVAMPVEPPKATPAPRQAPPPQPAPAQPAPAPRPTPVVAPQPPPQPAPQPAPLPAPKAPPSERAITAPVSQPAPARASEVKESAAPRPAVSEKAGQAPQRAVTTGAKSAAGATDSSSGPVTMPRVDAGHLNNPAPVYPAVSRRFREQGQVLLDVLILPDGTVGEIRLKTSSGYPRLDNAALAAVKRWRYVPARRGNTPIQYWYVQPMVFSLKN